MNINSMKNYLENVDDLKTAVERLHGGKASYIEKIFVVEKFGSKTAWEGSVCLFRLEGHSQTDLCYAWSVLTEGNKRRYYAVLHIPPIDSPEKAVRASIVHDQKQK